MSEANERDDKGAAGSGGTGADGTRKRMELKKPAETSQVRQSFSHGRSKTVTVEVKKKRTIAPGAGPAAAARPITAPAAASAPAAPKPATAAPVAAAPVQAAAPAAASTIAATPAARPAYTPDHRSNAKSGVVLRQLTDEEKSARARALEDSKTRAAVARAEAEAEANRRASENAQLAAEREAAMKRAAEEEARKKHDEEARKKAEEDAARRLAPEKERTEAAAKAAANTGVVAARRTIVEEEDDDAARRKRAGIKAPVRTPARPAPGADRRRGGKLTINQALEEEERVRSIASFRRAVAREKRLQQQSMAASEAPKKVVRDVTLPEVITVQELANRMAERAVDVIKALMKLGVMATINQSIDADTAELVVGEFGHRMRRVTETDVEIGLERIDDQDENKEPRPPVVTVMGHVDHGKTSLLDALRTTDVASSEAGGITQHIGAYQVHLKSGKAITFLDTPGHEAFTAMRARGARVTDIVILVVAADDSVMPQTIEAIRHAKAANVPVVVAINKCDKPSANPEKVRRELLQHDIVVEQMGGEVQSIEVSAKTGANLDKLEEAILVQAEVLELRANPNRAAEGVVVEAKLDRGRGSVATVLVQRGTLKVGDVFVAGAEWGRVRALVDDHGKAKQSAGPAMPTEVLGLQGTPEAGDDFQVVESEARAREIAEFRQRRHRLARTTQAARGTMEQMFARIKAGETKELPILVKTDVQGSLEAILASAQKLGTDEVSARILHAAVGGINESDVTLAAASRGMIIAFNVRANKQARDLATRDGVDIRYYSIIYNVIEDLKAMMSGLLAPTVRENFLGYAEIREVFNITKVGKVAGCMVTEGLVKRGSNVRLLRDNVVIHEGPLSTLKRFKDEVREVKQGMECGMSFENYNDIQKGDMIECFELESVARQL